MRHLKTALQNNFRLETKLLSDSNILPAKNNLLIHNFPAYTLPLPKYKIRTKRKRRDDDCPPCPDPAITRNKNATSHLTDLDSSEVFSGIELEESDFVDDSGKSIVPRRKTKADTKFSTKEKFNTVEFAEIIRNELISNNRKIDNKEVKQLFETVFNLKPDSYVKEIQESYELALVKYARGVFANRLGELGRLGHTQINEIETIRKEVFEQILAAYNNQPVLNVRTSDSVARQAYSTPIPLGFLISFYLDLHNSNSYVFEPCAGNGSLLITAPGNNRTTVNEIDATRLKHLEDLGFKTISGSALEYRPHSKTRRIVMNPPFGFYQPKIKFKGETIHNIDQAIAIHSLQFLEKEGLAAIILGGHNLKKDKHGGFKANDRFFLDYIYKNFDVILNLDINGDLYRKQGTSFDIRLIILKNSITKNYSHVIPFEYGSKPGQITKVNSWDELYNILNDKNATSHFAENEYEVGDLIVYQREGYSAKDYGYILEIHPDFIFTKRGKEFLKIPLDSEISIYKKYIDFEEAEKKHFKNNSDEFSKFMNNMNSAKTSIKETSNNYYRSKENDEQRTREHSDRESESLEKPERETREFNLSNERTSRKSRDTRNRTSSKQKDGSRGHSRGNSKQDSGRREETNQRQDGNDTRPGLPGEHSSDSVRDSVVEFDENKANVMMEFFKKFGM